MLTCPFLKKIPMNQIKQNSQNILSYSKFCPYLNSLKTMTHDQSPSLSVGEVSDNILKCPFLNSEKENSSIKIDLKFDDVDDSNRDAIVNTKKECIDSIKLMKSDNSELLNNNIGLNETIPTCNVINSNMQTENSILSNSKKECLNNLITPLELNKPVSNTFNFSNFFDEQLKKKKEDKTYRVFRNVLRIADSFPYAHNYAMKSNDVSNLITVWCSNDYLGMTRHPLVREAALNAIKMHGTGSGGTRNISGNSPLHEGLESELASLHQKQSALVFSSCYVANETTLYTLGSRLHNAGLRPIIFSDKGNHASMIHGIRTSPANKVIFPHNDFNSLDKLLSSEDPKCAKIVAFETVHSMTGDVCPLKELIEVSKLHNALSFVDEVHAVGLYGENGAGVAEREGLMHKIDAITGTLGKAFANFGGYLAGDKNLVDTVRSYGAGFIFTTSLPPATLCAAQKVIQILRSDEGRHLRQVHQTQVKYLRKSLFEAGLPVLNTPSHIIPIHVGEPELSAFISDTLLHKHNIYVQHINYPTVARGQERLRIAPSPFHTNELCDQLVSALLEVWQECVESTRFGSVACKAEKYALDRFNMEHRPGTLVSAF